jgi:phage tail-like protein
MARAQASDPFHNFRFHARAGAIEGLAAIDGLQPGGVPSPGVGDTAEAGFTSVTIPEFTVETAEYREGIKTYTEKYPGIPTTNDCTFSRGVGRNDTAFFQWTLAAIEGREYRTDITILHATRAGRAFPHDPATNFPNAETRRIFLFEAFPIRVKLAGDLDASTSDVGIMEMDVAIERFGIIRPDGVRVGV